MCKRFAGRRVPPRHCRHQGEHRSPRVTRHAAATRRSAAPDGTPDARPGRATAAHRPRTTPDDRRDTRRRAPRRRRATRRPPRTAGERGRSDAASGPPSRGRRECGMWSLSRMGRVSRSASDALGRGPAVARRRRPLRAACRRAAGATAARPVSAAPGAPVTTGEQPGVGGRGAGPSGARRRPPRRLRRLGARRRPVAGAPPSPERDGDRRRRTAPVSSARAGGRRWTGGPGRRRARAPSGRLAVADGVGVGGPGAPHRTGAGRTDISWVGRATMGRGGRDREVALRQAQGGQVGPRRLLDAAEDDPHPHLAGAVGVVPPAEQLARPTRYRPGRPRPPGADW